MIHKQALTKMPDIQWNYIWGPQIAHWYQQERQDHFGDHWGDPEREANLAYIRDTLILPYVRADHSALEIGCGGGRWTQYLLGFGRLYCVELNVESFQYLLKRFGPRAHVSYCKTNGTDFPGVPPGSVDFAFSFDVFVHLEPPLIEQYLRNLRPLLKPCANVVIHYADQTKPGVDKIVGFAQTNADVIRTVAEDAGYSVVAEDRTSLWHSNLVHLQPAGAVQTAVSVPLASSPTTSSFAIELPNLVLRIAVEDKR